MSEWQRQDGQSLLAFARAALDGQLEAGEAWPRFPVAERKQRWSSQHMTELASVLRPHLMNTVNLVSQNVLLEDA